MKFALFYEIPVAKPWDEESEHRAYKDAVMASIELMGKHVLPAFD